MPRKKSEEELAEEDLTMDVLESTTGGERARTVGLARRGLPTLRKNQEIAVKSKAAAQLRACRALMWERERVLEETGWSLQWYISIEKFVADEDRRIWSETDPRTVFSTYRDQQLQIANELEDLAKIFRGSKQFSALVSAQRTRSEILDKIVKTGQELGVVSRTAKQVEITGQVDITRLDVQELRVHIEHQMNEVRGLLTPGESSIGGATAAVMRRLDAKFREVPIEAESTPVEEPRVRKVRRKTLATPQPPNEPEDDGEE